MLVSIKDLKASVEGKEILKGLNLDVNVGEVHAIMGPNGSGKSTLASVLAGKDNYEVTGGSVTFDGKDLLEMDALTRVCHIDETRCFFFLDALANSRRARTRPARLSCSCPARSAGRDRKPPSPWPGRK